MKCEHCGHENREKANFCDRCGVKLKQQCSFCWVNRKENYYCGFKNGGCSSYKLFLKRLRVTRALEHELDITDKDLHCVARLIQGTFYANQMFYGCQYCKYKDECVTPAILDDGHIDFNKLYDEVVRMKLQDLTGVRVADVLGTDLEARFKNYNSGLEEAEL